MCGIVGVASSRDLSSPPSLEAAAATMAHRGPDDSGAWWSPDRRVGLAMRRLAIIDLSPAGHQPMADLSGSLRIVFNGEIYNYRELRSELEGKGRAFASASDTEVMLAAYREWGDRFLEKLNGMFAIALYDANARRVLLARDRAGEKPLFYAHDGSAIRFASELKALMADPAFSRRLDPAAFCEYLTYGYVSGSACILAGVRKLPPAHALSFDAVSGNLRVWPYWSLPNPPAEPAAEIPEMVDEVDALLADSVRLRLIADVPVGLSLSGGIDSSLVTAMAARASSRPVRTFTFSVPGHAAHDESPFARLVASHFGAEHTELATEPVVPGDLLPQLARQFDEPIADSSMVPTYLVSRLIRQHATVALGGDGGDELFGGYLHYAWAQRQDRLGRTIPRGLRRFVSRLGSRLPLGVRGRGYLVAFDEDAAKTIAYSNLFFDERNRRRLWSGSESRCGGPPEDERARLARRPGTPLQNATRVDFLTYLPDDILVKVDRASMLASLEMRAPFLDPRIIELAFGRLPEAMRAGRNRRKIILKKLAARLLPPALDLERKQGFSIPLSRWFKGDWGRFMIDVLRQPDSPFDRGMISDLIAGERRGLRNAHRLFALTMFELWRREYGVTV